MPGLGPAVVFRCGAGRLPSLARREYAEGDTDCREAQADHLRSESDQEAFSLYAGGVYDKDGDAVDESHSTKEPDRPCLCLSYWPEREGDKGHGQREVGEAPRKEVTTLNGR